MYYYHATFTGRRNCGIGVTHKISKLIHSDKPLTEVDVISKLYDTFEYITNLKIENKIKSDATKIKD